MKSDSQDDQIQNHKIEQINIYQLIPKAKPVIQTNRIFDRDYHQYKFTQPHPPNLLSYQKSLFQKQGTIQQGFIFSSHFQSGNIIDIKQIHYSTFQLRLRSDTNSYYQSQWFYFKVKGIKKAQFIIIGFKKTDSLFNYGMKICVNQSGKWKRAGTSIKYFKYDQYNYALKFEYSFNNSQNITQFAYCFPFTNTEWKKYLSKQLSIKRVGKPIKNQIITKTFLNNQINCLTFGQQASKPIILIMARVHPGETVSSFVLKVQTQQKLIKYFQIKIIPLLNPDGVKLGNYRYSYAGRDLNRCWKYPHPKITPEIFKTKQYIQQYNKRIRMIIDLHGHSRKKNVFFYGCQQNKNDRRSKQFPYLMSKLSNYFSYANSSFNLDSSKQGTARITLWKMLKIPYIYTMQTSFCGCENSGNFLKSDFQKIGTNLIKGINVFFSDLYKQQNQESKLKKKLFQEFQNQIDDYSNQNSNGSDSRQSQGKFDDNLIQQILLNEEIEKKNNKFPNRKNNYSSLESKPLSIHIRKKTNLSLRTPKKESTNKQVLIQQKMQKYLTEEKKSPAIKKYTIYAQQKQQMKTYRLKNSINHFQSLQNQFFQIPSASSKFQTFKIIRTSNQAKSINSILIDQNFLKSQNLNLGTQYLRLKNYAQRLKQQRSRFRTSKLYSHQPSSLLYQKRAKQDINLVIKPLKSHRDIIMINNQQKRVKTKNGNRE